MSPRIRRFVMVFVSAGGASFLTMLIVQYFMGGIRDLTLALGKSFMIGFGLAIFIALLPKSERDDYPWR